MCRKRYTKYIRKKNIYIYLHFIDISIDFNRSINLGRNRVDDEIRLAGKPSCLSTAGRGVAGDRNIFHSLVLRVRGHQHQIHTGYIQGAADFPGRGDILRLWSVIPAALGRDLCIKGKSQVEMLNVSRNLYKEIIDIISIKEPAIAKKSVITRKTSNVTIIFFQLLE